MSPQGSPKERDKVREIKEKTKGNVVPYMNRISLDLYTGYNRMIEKRDRKEKNYA